LAENRDQERALLTFESEEKKPGYFQIKIGDLEPSEMVIVET
jgi:hypothetical protein